MAQATHVWRTYVFIDASNIIYGCRESEWKMDFEKLYSYLTRRFRAVRILYYAGVEESNAAQLRFYRKMCAWGYELVLKPVKKYRSESGGTIRKANVDVDLTFDAMVYERDYEAAIFMTGDGDFCRLIAYLKEHKALVRVIGNARRSARELKVLMQHHFIDLDDLRNTLSR